MTKQRRLILDIVQNNMAHMTAKEIYDIAQKMMPGITFATIYNNLNSLVDEGKILRVKIVDQPDHFDHTLTPHHHKVCDLCGLVDDIDLPDYLDDIKSHSDVDILYYDLAIHYICDSCKQKKGN